MTAQDLFDHIYNLTEKEIAQLEKATSKNYLERRRAITEAARAVYDAAAVDAHLDTTVGNVVYVSKAEAFKYGRMDKLAALVREEARKAAAIDIANLEKTGARIYETGYDGYAWAYKAGYGLPVTGGAKVRLLAKALYSDFYGAPFDETVKKNLGRWPDDIMNTITRELNQGHSYSAMAKKISDSANSEYWKALRVARTESGRISSQAMLDSNLMLDDLGIEYTKVWVHKIGFGSKYNAREDHIDMDGQEADKNGVFHLPSGASGPAPRQMGEASEDCNCACFFVMNIAGEKPYEKRVKEDDVLSFSLGKPIPIGEIRAARG